MQVCKQRQDVADGHVDFPSKTRPDKPPYRVYAFRPGGMPMCTCMPFLTSRKKAWTAAGGKASGKGVDEFLGTCSHIKKVFKDTCQWDETKGGATINGVCPECGGPVVDVDENRQKVEAPDDPVAAILATQARLRGEAPPEPTPAPEPKQVRPAARVELRQIDRTWMLVVNGHEVVGVIDEPENDDDPSICVFTKGEVFENDSYRLADLVEESDADSVLASLVSALPA